MHDYAVFDHNRATIGRWLGVASIIITGGLASLFIWLQDTTGVEVFAKATVTTALVYFCLHWTFNKLVWKLDIISVPNINGIWFVNGETLTEDGEVKYEWNAEIDIEQTWEKISINLKTAQSSSTSYTATLAKKSGSKGGWVLHYSYTNNPAADQYHELNTHKGYCELIFDSDLKVGEAAYFNNNGRRTFGRMTLDKEVA